MTGPAPDFRPASPTPDDYSATEEIRRGWLVLVALLGAVLVALAIAWNVIWDREDILPSVLLELGAGALLFSLLFGVERVSVRKVVRLETDRLYRALKPHSDGSQELEAMQERVYEDMAKLGIAPFEAGHNVYAAAATGDFELLWTLSDDNWQLCRVQAWLWNNRSASGYEMTLDELNELASDLKLGPGNSPLWDSFSQIEGAAFKESYPSPENFGVGNVRRVVAPGAPQRRSVPVLVVR